MVELPLSWNRSRSEQLQPSNIIFGFIYDENDHTYGLYITNFKNVWSEVLTRNQLLQKAGSFGLERLTDSQVVDLLKSLKSAINDLKEIPLEGFDSKNGSMKLTIRIEELSWPFELLKRTDNESVQFLAALNFQQFSIQNSLNYKVADLQRIMKKKDYFIKFLSENFKSSHGDELIRKFRKNHHSDIESLDPFNEEKWKMNSDSRYLKGLKKTLKVDTEILIWEFINSSINNKGNWCLANSYLNKPQGNKSKTDSNVPDANQEPIPSIIHETDVKTQTDMKTPNSSNEDLSNTNDDTKTLKLEKVDLDTPTPSQDGEQKSRVIRKRGMVISPNKKKRKLSK